MREQVYSFCGTDDPLLLKLRGGMVRRYHNEGALIERGLVQSVDQHTWRLLVILLHFWPAISREAIIYAIMHDVPEGFSGDAPATVKRLPAMAEAYRQIEGSYEDFLDLPKRDTITDEEYHKIKIADYLELCLTCARFRPIGAADRIFRKGLKFIKDSLIRLPAADVGVKQVEQYLWLLETKVIHTDH